MEIPTQLSLDFETIQITKFNNEYAFLSNEADLGFAKILKEINGTFELYFPSKELFKTVNKTNVNLILLPNYPNALQQWEEFPRAMEIALIAHQLKRTHNFNKLSSLSNF